MNYELGAASKDDVLTLAEIMNHYILNTTVSFYNQPLTGKEMYEKVFFEQPYYQTFVVKNEGIVVGYCAVSQWKKQQAYRHTAEINIYLRHDLTGKGLGPAILAHAEQFAKENDIRTLIAGLCSENLPSKKLFEKSGYQQCANFEKVGNKFGRELGVIYLQKFI